MLRAAVADVVHGDSNAFSVILQQIQARIHALSRSFFSNPEDRLEYCQDFFIFLFRRLPRYRGTGPFTAWSCVLARRFFLRQVRRKRISRVPLPEQPLPAQDGSDTAAVVAGEETAREVIRALQRLPEKYSMLLRLFYYGGLPYEEIAAACRLPLNTVRTRLRRGKELLREQLSAAGYGEDGGRK